MQHMYTYIPLYRCNKFGKMLIAGSSGGYTEVPYILLFYMLAYFHNKKLDKKWGKMFLFGPFAGERTINNDNHTH